MSTMNGELGNAAFTIASAQTRYSTSTLARKEYDDTAFSLAEQKYQAFLRRKLRTAVPLPHFTVAQMETSWTECKEPDIPARPKEKQTDGNIFGSKKYPTNGLAALNGAKPCDSAAKSIRRKPLKKKTVLQKQLNMGVESSFSRLSSTPTRGISRSPSAKEYDNIKAKGTALPTLSIYSSPKPIYQSIGSERNKIYA